ncbi:ferredoxin [Pseudonocardia sp. C8]|uniref:ferredoxin n=1 Tax=Pseudonocardia sp. C8 TaxID=2762759 RepID=UPI001642CFD1|nr:ferredoxin [Pseudonocardia sp. C8]MBC3191095.1 ferredoxin [Pseudonocardia sp. C8]
MRIVLDESKCSGLGMCEAEAPDLFEVQDDGSLRVLDDRPPEDQYEVARAACDACPTEALSIVEDDR